MKHRHSGPKVQYRTRRGRVRFRDRPLHSQSLMSKNKNKSYKQLRRRYNIRPLADDDKDGVRNYMDCKPWDKKRQDYDPREQERHLDNINQLKSEIKELQEEWKEKEEGISDLDKATIRFDRDRFKHFTDEERRNLTTQEINEIFESEKNPYKVDRKQLVEEESNLREMIDNKLKAIEEEIELREI